MALAATVHEQLAQREARLRLVPANERPLSPRTRARVERWEADLQAAADTIRWADAAIEQLAGLEDVAERERLLPLVRAARVQALGVVRQLNPDQAWFWTEEWQAGERAIDRRLAAGEHGTIYYTDEEFDAALRAHLHDPEPNAHA
jgi:hypothetical protein